MHTTKHEPPFLIMLCLFSIPLLVGRFDHNLRAYITIPLAVAICPTILVLLLGRLTRTKNTSSGGGSSAYVVSQAITGLIGLVLRDVILTAIVAICVGYVWSFTYCMMMIPIYKVLLYWIALNV